MGLGSISISLLQGGLGCPGQAYTWYLLCVKGRVREKGRRGSNKMETEARQGTEKWQKEKGREEREEAELEKPEQ